MGGIRIFFDVDGVLIDGYHHRQERRRRWDKDLEKDLDIKNDHFQEIFTGWFQEVLRGRLDFKTAMTDWLKARGHHHDAQEVIDYWHSKDSIINRPTYEVVERLSKRKNIQLYTATNQSYERIEYLRYNLGFEKHFTDFYFSARLGCIKHDPNYFAQIEKDLGFDPHIEPPLFFDDDPRNIEVSSKRGWNAVLVDGPEDVVNHPQIREFLS